MYALILSRGESRRKTETTRKRVDSHKVCKLNFIRDLSKPRAGLFLLKITYVYINVFLKLS